MTVHYLVAARYNAKKYAGRVILLLVMLAQLGVAKAETTGPGLDTAGTDLPETTEPNAFRGNPPNFAGTVALELTAGYALGAAGMLVGGTVGWVTASATCGGGSFGCMLVGAFVGAPIGAFVVQPFATAAGVHVVGTKRKVPSRYWMGVLGGALGGVVAGGCGVGIGFASETGWLAAPLVCGLIPTMGATMAYNLSRDTSVKSVSSPNWMPQFTLLNRGAMLGVAGQL